jgi:N-acetylmuramoyl-L-alanine amidase
MGCFQSFCFVCALLFLVPMQAEVLQSSSSLRNSTARVQQRQSATLRPVIMLDAGHGGRDEGTKIHTFKEKRITLSTTLYTKKYLEEMGYRVILTRSRDVEMSLHRRVSLANSARSALFISIHFNASRNTSAQGVEVFYYDSKDGLRSKQSRKLAHCILRDILDHTAASSRGVKMGNFHVIRETTMPAVLVEGGFVTNYEECCNLRKRDYLDKIAKGIAQGVDKFLRG